MLQNRIATGLNVVGIHSQTFNRCYELLPVYCVGIYSSIVRRSRSGVVINELRVELTAWFESVYVASFCKSTSVTLIAYEISNEQ